MGKIIYQTSEVSKWVLFGELMSGEEIRNRQTNSTFAFIASSGFGPTGDQIKLAEKVVDFLNSLP